MVADAGFEDVKVPKPIAWPGDGRDRSLARSDTRTDLTRNHDRPSVSVVVATNGRPHLLPDCLASVAAGMADGDEVVVVESGGTAGADAAANLGVSVQYLPVENPRRTAKVNAAIRVARGEVILLTDDDCRVHPDWVEAMARPFTNPAVGIAFGPVVGLTSVSGESLPQLLPGPAPPELWLYAHGPSMAVRRPAATDVGGLDERFGPGATGRGGEEADLVLRLAARGWTCEIVDAPPVEHLNWRDDEQSIRNVVVYQRGSGAYLGAGLRRDPVRTVKPFVLRLLHEMRARRDSATHGWRLGFRMTAAFAAGLAKGVTLSPRRFLNDPATARSSTGRPRVLWVTDEPPDRRQGGGNIRQAKVLDALHRRIDFTVLLAGRLDDDVTRRHATAVLEVPVRSPRVSRGRTRRRARDLWQAAARRLPSDVNGAARVRRTLRPVLQRVADEFDVVIVQHLHLAPLVTCRRHSRWLLVTHHIRSEQLHQEASVEPGRRQRWLLSRDFAKAKRFERRTAALYDAVVVVSDEDAAVVAARSQESGRAPIVVVPNGVDTSEIVPTPIPDDPNILFLGSLNYRPNVLGAVWFSNAVLPHVQDKVPDVHFDLVGRQPVPEVVALTRRPGVHLHGDVPSTAPWLTRARVLVVPLRIGSGTRLKALEAMAAGRPVVGTTVGLAGLGIVDGEHARVVDDPQEMADAIVGLLAFDPEARSLADAGRRLVVERFSWTTVAEPLGQALDTMTATARERNTT
jgi:glycosyltransferase involved in cell wall biosynthesis/GT2 family glycosyltransferase